MNLNDQEKARLLDAFIELTDTVVKDETLNNYPDERNKAYAACTLITYIEAKILSKINNIPQEGEA